MTTTVKLKAKQDDLRRLMKERRENLQARKDKVDSPFAKYNSLGQLSCIICNVQIKSNSLWVPHIAGKIHKENALRKKKGNLEQTKEIVKVNHEQSKEFVKVGQKRPEDQPPVIKKIKTIDTETKVQQPIIERKKEIEEVQKTSKGGLLEGYSSSSEDENDSPEQFPNGSSSQTCLPPDFFDVAPSNSNTGNMEETPKEEKPSEIPANSVETLPEGFFDDPVLDAKARNIVYKDPVEEEWEKFQKTIEEETNVSKTIMEEDLEETTLEREIFQIDEQIHLWDRLHKLQSLADKVKMKASEKTEDRDATDSTDEDLEEDDLLDWRSKGVKKA